MSRAFSPRALCTRWRRACISRAAITALALSLTVSPAIAAGASQTQTDDDPVTAVLRRLERILLGADTAAFLALLTDSADQDRARDFTASELLPGVTRAVVQERSREPLPGTLPGQGYQLMVEVFAERSDRARIATWRLDVKLVSEASAPGELDEWRIADQERLNFFEGLYKIALDATTQYDARDLKIAAEDLELTLAEGSVFVARTEDGVTGVVLMGRGDMRFAPPSRTEKGQVRIFSGSDAIQSRFDAAFIRLNPADFESVVGSTQISARPVDPRELRRADEIFRTESPKSFNLDLADLSREPWSLLPPQGDFLAEVRTRRFNTLTYARSAFQPEDITLFDRKRRRNIAIYPSAQKIERNGRFYNEDDLAEYDILDYDIDLSVSPDREWLEGLARVRLQVKSYALGTITMRLDDSLSVRSIVCDEFGRLFGIRVKNQNSIVINLPATVPQDTVLEVTIAYSGRVPPQKLEREAAALGGAAQEPRPPRPSEDDVPFVPAEPNFLYSTQVFWYPQGPNSDYATASLRVVVPVTFDCVATGEMSPQSPTLLPTDDSGVARKLYAFNVNQPIRYLAVLVSRFVPVDEVTIAFDAADAPDTRGLPPLGGDTYTTMSFLVEANPRQVDAAREVADRAIDIARFYARLIGDSPYPSFTVALVESDEPGGHSPAYFAVLNVPLPMKRFNWRNDPVVFSAFPEFFLAHELAHQWWGQAVGWANYHERWLSEGFAQYFAALYAQHDRGDETFTHVMRQLRKWSLNESDKGPVYLGYRLGHIRGEGRTFRALVYNKGAAVLHMLRRLVGDDTFFRGLQRFYRSSRFRKVGTEDFRKAMEAEAGRSLERFFERWIHGSTLPALKFSYRVDGSDVVLHFEQAGDLFDVPVAVTLEYADGTRVDVVVPVSERSTDMRVALAGSLKNAEVSKDDVALAEVVKN